MGLSECGSVRSWPSFRLARRVPYCRWKPSSSRALGAALGDSASDGTSQTIHLITEQVRGRSRSHACYSYRYVCLRVTMSCDN